MKNKYHVLTEQHNIKFDNDFIFLDTETHIKKGVKQDVQTLKLGWCLYWNRKLKIEEYFYFETAAAFWNYVESRMDKEIILYAHNTEFDFKIVDGYRELLLKRGWEIKNIYIEGARFILVLTKDDSILKIYDTMNYIPFSLAAIGKSIGIPKMSINFETCTHEELKIYCKNDVLIIFEFIKKLLEFLHTYDLASLRATAGSIAFNAFRHKFYDRDKNPIHIHAQTEAIKLERKSYKGGITDCFKIGNYKTTKTENNTLYKYDINSMYPFIMRSFESPVKLLYYNAVDPEQDIRKYLTTNHIIINCDVYLPEKYAYILTKQKILNGHKSVFLKGEFNCSICTPEIKFILKYGKIKKIYELAVYEKSLIYKEYIDFFYKKRLEFKKNKNESYQLITKLLMNTLYGKAGQRETNIELLSESMTYDIDKYHMLEKDRDYIIIHLGNKLFKQEQTEENAYDSFVAIASMVTSYSRMYLIEMILEVGRENLYYVDTDSLIVNAAGKKRLSKYLDNDKLGFLKLEEISDDSTFIRPKFYDFNGSLKCKGVRKQHKTLSENVNEWVVMQEQFVRYKTALKEKSIDRQVVKHIVKHINKGYDKGIVLNNDVFPYDIDYIEAMNASFEIIEKSNNLNEIKKQPFIKE